MPLNFNSTPISSVTGPREVTTGAFFSKTGLEDAAGPQNLVAGANFSMGDNGLLLAAGALLFLVVMKKMK